MIIGYIDMITNCLSCGVYVAQTKVVLLKEVELFESLIQHILTLETALGKYN